MKSFFRHFRYGEKGFTLIELLVVVAILGVLAAVAVPNVGKFIGKGKEEARETERHNVLTGVMALMADSVNGYLDGGIDPNDDHELIYDDITDLDAVMADGGAKILTDYMTGLNEDGTTKLDGVSYDIYEDGTVVQNFS